MRIVVAGGTGVVGRYVVQAGREAGHHVVVMARSTGTDFRTGEGVDEAVAGADAVIDVSNVTTVSARVAKDYFGAVARTLLAASRRQRVGHHVVLSIVGIDGAEMSYYAGKLLQERIVAESDVPHSIARAGQFHEFAGQMLQRMRGPIAYMPTTPMRPVSAREVGAHLVRVAEEGPVGRARDLVGPRDEELSDVVRRQLAFDGIRRPVLGARLPGSYGRLLASGAMRGGPEALNGTVTFDEWLRGPDHARG